VPYTPSLGAVRTSVAPTPVQTGSLTVTDSVSVTYVL
jgi:uncharacterized protein YggE